MAQKMQINVEVVDRLTATMNRMADTMDKFDKSTKRVKESMKSAAKQGAHYSEESKKMRLTTSNLRFELGKLRNSLLLVTFAYQTLKRFVIPAIKAFETQEDAENKLYHIMVVKNKESKIAYENALKNAAALQILTGTTDEEILTMQRALETSRHLTRQQKDELVPLLIDLNEHTRRATGETVGLDRVQKAVARALVSSTDSLKELGINLERYKRGSLTATQVIKILRDQVGGTAEDVDTFSKSVRILKARISDLKEPIGMLITQYLTPFVESLSEVDWESMYKSIEEFAKIANAIGKISLAPIKMHIEAWKLWLGMIEGVNKLHIEFLDWIVELLGLMPRLNEEIVDLGNILITDPPKAASGFDKLTDSIMETWKTLRAGEQIAQTTALSMTKSFSTFFFDAMTGDLKDLEEYFRDFGTSVLKILTDIAAKMLIMKLFPWTTPFLTPSTPQIATQHTGGPIKPKRFATGGAVPILAESGEGVINREGMRNFGLENLNRINRGEAVGGSGTTNIYNIVAMDALSFQEFLRKNGSGVIEDTMSNALVNNKPYRNISRQTL